MNLQWIGRINFFIISSSSPAYLGQTGQSNKHVFNNNLSSNFTEFGISGSLERWRTTYVSLMIIL